MNFLETLHIVMNILELFGVIIGENFVSVQYLRMYEWILIKFYIHIGTD